MTKQKKPDYPSLMKKALLEIRELKAKVNELEQAKNQLEQAKLEPIAIVGMAFRFPGGANDPDAYWKLLRDGVDAISEIPPERWDVEAYYDPEPSTPGKMFLRHAGFIDQPVDQFDPAFFGISPREASSIDPQHRLLLEASWEALENAGLAPDKLRRSATGVFVGISTDDYAEISKYDPNNTYYGLGTHRSFGAGRLAYVMGLQGPTIQLDTACSSSLVAIHLAVQSLRANECHVALAGGVNLMLSPLTLVSMSSLNVLAPDGRSKTFDGSANGYGRGEGCGIVVLKRLSDAEADGDPIWAVIRGSAVNHDGPSSGLTVPNELAQEELIRQALTNAQVEPDQITLIEAHGTGTSLGDPIEVGALASVFGKSRQKPLLVGSVKTNFGHLEAAAGVAGLIKVVLSLQHGAIPAHLHFNDPNPNIPWERMPWLTIPIETTAWPSETQKRLAGVSSFAISGTNAHVILEAAPRSNDRSNDPSFVRTCFSRSSVKRPLHLLALSAKSKEALTELVARYEAYLATNPADTLANICFTANTGRSHFPHRLSVVCESKSDLHEKLQEITQRRKACPDGGRDAKPPRSKPVIAFLFTGQGSQYVGMGQRLYESEPTFRQTLDRCDEILRPILDQSLLSVLYARKGDEPNRKSPIVNLESPINQTAYTQPALFALEYALAELWKSWGIQPDVVMGHSVGEYVAACVAGVFSLEDGLKLIAERGRLMQATERGEMVAVFADQERLKSLLQGAYSEEVSIAAINGPESMVISGESHAVRRVAVILEKQGIKNKFLKVSHAFHSPLMEPILDQFLSVARQVRYCAPRLKMISNVTGEVITAELITSPQYWARHIRSAVRFADGMKTLDEMDVNVFLEIGPKPILLGMGRNCLPQNSAIWLPSLRPNLEGVQDWAPMLHSLGELYVRGATVDWDGFDQAYLSNRRRVVLPTYPFQRERCWFDDSVPSGYTAADSLTASPWSPVFDALHRGEINLVTDQLAKAGHISDEVKHFSTQLLDALAKEHQQQLATWDALETEEMAIGDEWVYEVEWQPKPREVDPFTDSHEESNWLILADQGGLGDALAEYLQSYGQATTVLYASPPEENGYFERLLQEQSYDVVIHMWAMDVPRIGDDWMVTGQASLPASGQALDDSQRLGCGSLLQLVQALSHSEQSARIWVVTRGAMPVGTHPVAVAQAPLWGMGKVVHMEHPSLWGGILDLSPEPEEGAARLRDEAVNILTEIGDSDGEGQIAFRNGKRFVSRLVRAKLPTNFPSSSYGRGSAVRADSSYLITGGLGGLGIQVASFLAEQGAGQIVLASRSGAKGKEELIKKLEATGCIIKVMQADVSEARDVARLIEKIEEIEETEEVAPLRGIIHAAGVLDDGILLRQTFERFQKVMAPKVQGTWNLHLASQQLPLDFFVCFSSAVSLLGSPGQGNYAAANTFMDAVAHQRHFLGLPALSINWGIWGEVGMAARVGVQIQGAKAMTPEQGIAVLHRLLQQADQAQVGVLRADWSKAAGANVPPYLSELVAPLLTHKESEPSLSQRLANATPSARPNMLSTHVQHEVAHVLGASRLPDIQQGFFEMGMDSLMAVELTNRLGAVLNLSLSSTLVFNYATIEALTEQLLSVIGLTATSEEERPTDETFDMSADELMALIDEEFEAYQ